MASDPVPVYWPPASAQRRMLAVYIDFIVTSSLISLMLWALSFGLPALRQAPLLAELAIFIPVELALLRFLRWSPGNDLLGIRPAFATTAQHQPSLLTGQLVTDPAIYFKERWWSVLFGVLVLLNGLKTAVRWTAFTPPTPFFGLETSQAVSAVILTTGGALECLVAVSAFRLRRSILPLAAIAFGSSAVSAALSWSLWPAWVEALTVARRAYQGMPVRPGEVHFMQALIPTFVIIPLVYLLWAAVIYFHTRRTTPA